MAKIRVYQFDYYSRAEGRILRSSDFATERAILEIGAVIARETCREVDEGDVGRAGYLLAERQPR